MTLTNGRSLSLSLDPEHDLAYLRLAATSAAKSVSRQTLLVGGSAEIVVDRHGHPSSRHRVPVGFQPQRSPRPAAASQSRFKGSQSRRCTEHVHMSIR